MKYLLVLAVVFVAFYLWRNNRLEDRRADPPRKSPPQNRTPTIMVACRQCGTHLPENEAVQGSQGVYCSAEHRRLLEG